MIRYSFHSVAGSDTGDCWMATWYDLRLAIGRTNWRAYYNTVLEFWSDAVTSILGHIRSATCHGCWKKNATTVCCNALSMGQHKVILWLFKLKFKHVLMCPRNISVITSGPCSVSASSISVSFQLWNGLSYILPGMSHVTWWKKLNIIQGRTEIHGGHVIKKIWTFPSCNIVGFDLWSGPHKAIPTL
jgi:hypothetical protein